MHEQDVLDILKEQGVDIAVTLPCDRTKDLCRLIPEHFHNIALTREEDGIGICAGLALAGKRPVLHMQSSGLGNSLNAIMSLTMLYRLPLPVLASWRGIYNEKIPAQVPFNAPLPDLLGALKIPFTIISEPAEIGRIRDVIADSYENSRPHVALISPKVWEGGAPGSVVDHFPPRKRNFCVVFEGRISEPRMTRNDAIKIIAEELSDEAVVSNIGVPSKELFAARDRDENFYMLGSYTQATPIGLGLALGSDEEVVVLDGDGSLLGTAVLPVAAAEKPDNLTIICIDNGTFGSTGNQITHAFSGVDMELLAVAAGICNTVKVHSPEELRDALKIKGDGPRFIHVIIRPGNSDAPNIPLTPVEIKERFFSRYA